MCIRYMVALRVRVHTCVQVVYILYTEIQIYKCRFILDLKHADKCMIWGGYGQEDRKNYISLLQNIVSFIGLFWKRDL